MSNDRVRFRTPWLDVDSSQPPQPESRPTEPSSATTLAHLPPVPTPTWVSVAVFVCGMLAVAGVIAGPIGGNAETTGALIVAPFLFYFTWLIAQRIAAADGKPELAPIIMGGFCVKVIGAVLRYWVAAVVYQSGDFYDYDSWGRQIALGLHHGHWISLPGRLAGTNFMRFMTGFIYTISPSELMSGFLVYAWMSFIGILFFWRAYRLAVSDEYDVRYLLWLVLLPSLVYWPSSVGKDAFMVLAMGVATYGVACLVSRKLLAGLASLTVGLAAMCMVRPHVALIVCSGLVLMNLLRRYSRGFGQAIVSVAFVVGAGLLVAQSASSFFGIATFSRAAIQAQITDVSQQTAEGGSTFTPVVVNGPADFPLAAATVVYRPFVFETHSPQELLTSLEGLVLLGLSIRAFPRILRALRRIRDYPFIAYCLGAILVFIIAFSGFSNFGILARQRTVIEPLLLVFLTLPADFARERLPVPPRPV